MTLEVTSIETIGRLVIVDVNTKKGPNPMKTVNLTRSGQAPLKFEGELIADSAGRWHGSKEQNRYHDVALYRTSGGQYILWVSYVSSWQGELGHDTAAVYATPGEVGAALRDHDPVKHVAGWPPLPVYKERQERLHKDITARFKAQVSAILEGDEFAEKVE